MIRCGIIGYGGAFGMGKYHADRINPIPGLGVTAVCDIDPARLELAAEELPGIPTFEHVQQMIDAEVIDLGVVVTPHNTHADLAVALATGGKHVVCEKPMCITVAEASAMIAAARENDVMLSVFHNRRWDSDFLAIKKAIEDGLIGDVFHIEAGMAGYSHPGQWWRSDKAISGGGAHDWGAHFLDWTLNLMPGRVESAYGFYHNRVWHDVSNEDQCHIIMRFEGGRVAEFQVSSIAAVPTPRWRILGTKGGIIIQPYGESDPIKVVSYARGVRDEMNIAPIEKPCDFYQNIADHLLKGTPLAVTAESARRVIAVLEAAEKASETGQPQPVPYEDEAQLD